MIQYSNCLKTPETRVDSKLGCGAKTPRVTTLCVEMCWCFRCVPFDAIIHVSLSEILKDDKDKFKQNLFLQQEELYYGWALGMTLKFLPD